MAYARTLTTDMRCKKQNPDKDRANGNGKENKKKHNYERRIAVSLSGVLPLKHAGSLTKPDAVSWKGRETSGSRRKKTETVELVARTDTVPSCSPVYLVPKHIFTRMDGSAFDHPSKRIALDTPHFFLTLESYAGQFADTGPISIR